MKIILHLAPAAGVYSTIMTYQPISDTPKLHAWLAKMGVASRRQAEQLMLEGRVRVNGAVEKNVAARITVGKDLVEVDGKSILPEAGEVFEYWVLNKPAGVVSTARDPMNRPTVVSLVRTSARVYPVGRLDADSEGLVLLTNDGDLAYALTHPKFQIPKTYEVTVSPPPSSTGLMRLRTGVPLKDGLTAPAEVDVLSKNKEQAVLRVTIREGRHHQVRRMCKAVNAEVLQLKRVRLGTVELGSLPAKHVRKLTLEELASLQELVRKG